MKQQHTTSLLLVTLLSSPTLAAVNMKDASYTKSFSDFKDLQRTYNSRSLHDGIFGFGWCSDFEKKLDLSVSGQITLKDCTETTDIIYTNSMSQDGELLKSTASQYLIANSDRKLTFNKKGELTSIDNKEGKKYELTYDQSGYLRKIVVNKKAIFRLSYDYGVQKVKEILTTEKQALRFTYQEQNLLQTISAKKEVHSYKYDKLHNLQEILYPDQSMEALTYNSETDRVLTFRDRSGCIDHYQYMQKENYMNATLEKLCARHLVTRIEFEFFEKTRADGQSYLDRLKINDGTLIKEITYDAFSGAAKKITQKNALRLAASKGSYE